MNGKILFDNVRASLFSGAIPTTAVLGINAIIAAFETFGDGSSEKLAYMLATAFHETDKFATMEEYASGAAYEGRKDLGNTVKGDGKLFKGRGFVQITGRRNYEDWQRRLGIPLLANPTLAMNRDNAARILVEGLMRGTFTGKKLDDYIKSGDMPAFVSARRTVNGLDKAALIAGYAAKFRVAIVRAKTPPAPTEADELEKIARMIARGLGHNDETGIEWERYVPAALIIRREYKA